MCEFPLHLYVLRCNTVQYVQCTSLTKCTVVNGREYCDSACVCKFNNVRYCTFKVQCISLTMYTSQWKHSDSI